MARAACASLLADVTEKVGGKALLAEPATGDPVLRAVAAQAKEGSHDVRKHAKRTLAVLAREPKVDAALERAIKDKAELKEAKKAFKAAK